jgi:hypothetical protein
MTPLYLFLFLIGLGIICSIAMYFLKPTTANATNTTASNCSACGQSGNKEGFAQISMTNTTNLKYPLIDYFIKASALTAYDSGTNQMSLTKMNSVIRRGCRWLDFDVFSVDHRPVVGVSTTLGSQTPDSANTLPFDSVVAEIFKSALTTTGCPNSKDPLFINLRIRSSDTAIYPGVQSSLSNHFGSALYTNFIDPATIQLEHLAGRVILVLDVLNSDKMLASTGDDRYQKHADVKSLRTIAGLMSGHTGFPLTTQSSQLKQSPIPVMPVDPVTQEIRHQRQMGYRSESFVSAPKNSRDVSTKNSKTKKQFKNPIKQIKKQAKQSNNQIKKQAKQAKNPIKIQAKNNSNRDRTPVALQPSVKSQSTKVEPTADTSLESDENTDDLTTDEPTTDEPTTDEPELPDLDFDGMRDSSATHFRCSIPDLTSKNEQNPSVFKFIKDYGIQVVPYRFYKDDKNLKEYELLFAENGQVAFMPLSKAILVSNQNA